MLKYQQEGLNARINTGADKPRRFQEAAFLCPTIWHRSMIESPKGAPPQALTEPDVNLSIHPALVVQP